MKSIKQLTLEIRIAKLSQNPDAVAIVAKLKRKLRKLTAEQ